MFSTTHSSSIRRFRAAAIACAGLLAGADALGQTEVPRGGAEIVVGKGSQQVIVQIKNTTGSAAHDVTIGLEGVDKSGTQIKEVDVLDKTTDYVDDNGDGVHDKEAENDTIADPPSTVVKSIDTSQGGYTDGETIEVKIVFTGNTPDGAKLRVKFSTVRDGVHYDMLSVAPLGTDNEGSVLVTTGAAQIATGAVNVGKEPIAGLMLNGREPYFDPYYPPFVSVDRPAEVWYEDDTVHVAFESPLEPGEQAGVFLILPLPVLSEDDAFPMSIRPWMPWWCPADFNRDGVVNTLDVLAYLNAFVAGDPRADMNGDGIINSLDFILFLNFWTQGCDPG